MPDTNSEKLKKEIKITLSHERVHGLHALCSKLDKYAKKKWRALGKKKQKKYATKHPGYNWNDPLVAGREYLSFQYENKFAQLISLLEKEELNCQWM